VRFWFLAGRLPLMHSSSERNTLTVGPTGTHIQFGRYVRDLRFSVTDSAANAACRKRICDTIGCQYFGAGDHWSFWLG